MDQPKVVRVGIPAETHPSEKRVAATPATAAALRKLGLEVVVQSGAGAGASILDAAYAEVGARVVATAHEVWDTADLVLKVRAPGPLADGRHEAELLREGAWLVSFLWPAQNADLIARLSIRKATVLAMDAVPRITRAQKLDALSAMANIAGYRAVIEGAHRYGRFLGGQITAAGRVKPAEVLVIGAGVAGLAAVAAAHSLGAVVRAFDTRPAVREQVESLGAKFLDFQFDDGGGEGAGGYAKAATPEYLAAEQAMIASHCASADIVITTALVPGLVAPQLVTSGAVVGMRRGSVIVDLAAEQGGNCALTERDRVVEHYGVSIVGYTDMTSRLPQQSSELYSATVLALVQDLVKSGRPHLDVDDEVHRAMVVLHDGALMWPPPRPAIRSGAPAPMRSKGPTAMVKAVEPESPWPGRLAGVAGLAILGAIAWAAPPELLSHVTVFLLACVVGWHVIWNVTPALHTPLMSVTNAISGIILVGGLLLAAGERSGAAIGVGAAAVLLAAINVAGGFLVTQRMLRMFRGAA